MNYVEEIIQAISIALLIANFLLNTGSALKAIELCKESLVLLSNVVLSVAKPLRQRMYIKIYQTMFKAYYRVNDHTNAIACVRKLLNIHRECGDTVREAELSIALAQIYESQSMYAEAKEVYTKAIPVIQKAGDRRLEAIAFGGLGNVFYSLGEYVKAKEYYEKALAIRMHIGDRAKEGACYGSLGNVFCSLGEYVKAKEYYEKALAISMEIGDRANEGAWYGNLGNVFCSVGEYFKAKEYYEKALAIRMHIGDRAKEGACYGSLGNVFCSLGEYVKAKEYYEKALPISMEIGDRGGEGTWYGNLGSVFCSLGEYDKAKEYYEKGLAIKKEIGDRKGEGIWYGNLGKVFLCRGEYVKAKEHFEEALAISMEIGDRQGEGAWYGSLGDVFHSLGENVSAIDYYEKARVITMEIGHRKGQATTYLRLADVFCALGVYGKSNLYCEKALAISRESADKKTLAHYYEKKGRLHNSLGAKHEAQVCFEKAIVVAVEIGDRDREAVNYLQLGRIHLSLGNPKAAEKYLEKALSISENIGKVTTEFHCYWSLALTKVSQNNDQEALSLLFRGLKKSEKLRGFLQDSDQMKISLADEHAFPYQLLSAVFHFTRSRKDALHAAQLGRARALADLMATQYSVENRMSADPQSWTVVDNVMKKESNSTCLYISYFDQTVFLWILKTSGVIQFRARHVDKETLYTRLTKPAENLDEFFAIMAESFQGFGYLPMEVCEDRSLNGNDTETSPECCQQESPATLQRGKPGDTDDLEPSLTLFYELLVNPVSDLLDEQEIIIVPDRNLYRVPFAALLNESGKYLSERFRIRVVPSLSTLKLIQDSPADYHCETGALVVGDPDVGMVIYREEIYKRFVPLPGARREAEMIARRLGVWPLLGQDATKQAVLEKLNSVSLIHIAAPGNAERGEIALAPLQPVRPGSTAQTGIPQEDDYLLKMSDISKVKVRAKLVVLSCCHSGRGQIRAEGVVGIARAFLGAGARSVLVALWVLDDRATKKLMSLFYEHLIQGESASKSLHAAMKWMRDHGFTEVSRWAPFMLIGDDVTFAFEK